MQLKYMKNLLQQQDGAAKITALCWSPNNQKLAVCTSDRVILLFDENGERRDKFSTKPVDAKYGKKSYVVKSLAFSPDSTKIAVAQTDNIIYVYRIGDDWRDKKVICNKFVQQSAVLCLIWPTEGSMVFGLVDGKIRMANVKNNKSSTIYATESYVVSLTANVSAKGFLSGHANGSVVRYFFDGDLSGETQGKILTHSCPPYAMAWTMNGIMIGGCDKKIVAYNKDGKQIQQFDYNRDESEREFTSAACNPSGQSVVFGSFDRIRIFNWNPRKGSWEEAKPNEIANLYTITCLSWKRDGSKVVAGTLCGGVELFDCCLKKTIYKNKFEITYVGLSQVIVKNLATQSKVVLKSNYGYEIDDVRVLGQERYLLARTPETILLADLHKNKLSEIPWQGTGGNEKFYFDNANVCMIFNAGELTLVEYGRDDVLGSVRTEFMNPHLISVRINERVQKGVDENKKIAYLVDLKTISVYDLAANLTLTQISHDSKVDWLELNETGKKLLFRDKRLRLNLVDVESQSRLTILNYCSYVQWVPDSDVAVAQNRNNLCIWYNIDMPEKVTMFPIRGEVVDLERADGRTEVMVKDGVSKLSYTLDESLIEFRTAVDDQNYGRAVAFLETLEMLPETEAMWSTLAKLAMETRHLQVAQRCYAATGDVARSRYLQNVIELAEEMTKSKGTDGYDHYLVRVKLALLDRRFELAEAILLEHDDLEEAMRMYQKLHKWEEAIYLAEKRGHANLDAIKEKYLQWLLETHQEERAGELKEREGKHREAVNYFMKANMPAKAALLISTVPELASDAGMVSSVATTLIKADLYEKAGELYEKVHDNAKAMDCYRKGKAFQKAVELARMSFPREVVPLEEEWGDHLTSQKQLVAASNHYIEAGATVKALDAAISSHQWEKAAQIVGVINDPDVINKYYQILGKHFAAEHKYDEAESFFVKGRLYKEAVAMYNNGRMWEKSFRVATDYLASEESAILFRDLAKQLEEDHHLEDAEKLYVLLGQPDQAITMFKNNQQYDPMIRLVRQYHPDLLLETNLHLANDLESSGHYHEAERYYLEAKDWKAATNMYRAKGMWPEAYKVAELHGGSTASKQVAYLWAKHLGGEAAVKLLNKHGLLEFAITSAVETTAFDFAFSLARLAMKEKVPDIHLQHAMHLEDEGKFSEAEIEFIKAGKPKEAVLMYVHNRDWEDARRVAEAHDPDSMNEILVGQAESAFDLKDFARAESLVLRAQRPDVAVKYYKENDMWVEALRVCREYLPHKLHQLQEEYDREGGSASGGAVGWSSTDSAMTKAREWEEAGNFERAVDAYTRISQQDVGDVTILERAWCKAADLAAKFLDKPKAVETARTVAPRLRDIQRFAAAAQIYLGVGLNKDAIDCLVAGGDWTRARKVAKELERRYEPYVEEMYKESLKKDGKINQLGSVDVHAALELYAQKGEWRKCVELAEQQNEKTLHKYLAMYAADLVTNGRPLDALQLYSRHGAPAYPQNFNLYARITMDVLHLPDLNRPEAYKVWSELRDVLHGITKSMVRTAEVGATRREEFETLLLITHYYSNRSACLGEKTLDVVAAKLSVSLLRHTDIVPADKAYYEAGLAARSMGWENMAFVLLNRYLDLCEAIEEETMGALDNTDFQDTDIPFDVPLPEKLHVGEQQHEEVKEWVLAISMDQKVSQMLPTDERGTFEASLLASGGESERSPPCVITGYPVYKNRFEFKEQGRVANKDDWNKFLMATKMSHSEECQDVLRFISDWCGITSNLSYSFQ